MGACWKFLSWNFSCPTHSRGVRPEAGNRDCHPTTARGVVSWFECPSCSAAIRGRRPTFCPRCRGVSLVLHARRQSTDECRSCRRVIPAAARFCPHCKTIAAHGGAWLSRGTGRGPDLPGAHDAGAASGPVISFAESVQVDALDSTPRRRARAGLLLYWGLRGTLLLLLMLLFFHAAAGAHVVGAIAALALLRFLACGLGRR
jgi:hypothetical protein